MCASGTKLVEYQYDAWSKVTVASGSNANLAAKNPFRYRGYYYDSETGFYYLQSRYYDPQTGRFLNADAYADTGDTVLSTNMFAYCENNPVNGVDPSGEDFDFNKHIGGKYKKGSVTVFYLGNNAPQSKLGYCDAYDVASPIAGCDISALTFSFTYNKKQWRIELWKGSYAKGAMYGGEIGIYYSSNKKFYKCATDTSLTLSFILKTKFGRHLFKTNQIKTWWQTGFAFGLYHRYELSMIATITFPKSQGKFMDQFCRSISSGKLFKSRDRFRSERNGNSVKIFWG